MSISKTQRLAVYRGSIFWRQWLKKLWPTECVLCRRQDVETLCFQCRETYFSVNHRCFVCAKSLVDESATHCVECLESPPEFSRAFAAGDYRFPMENLVLGLKFSDNLMAAQVLASLLAEAGRSAAALDPEWQWPDCFIPVPLAASRLIKRGYNQSLELARYLARECDRPVYPQALLRREDDGLAKTQARLNRAERLDNVRGVYAVLERVAGKRVGLVDDVMTTGATCREIAYQLKCAGAEEVSVWVGLRTG